MAEQKHPLEGEYVLYLYGEQDCIGEGWALALYRMKNNRLEQIYHPADHVIQPSAIGEETNEQLLKLMEKKGIKEVYTVHHLDDFFGIPANWFSLEGILGPKNESEEVECWGEYKSVSRENEEYRLLQAKGIKVNFYEEPRIKKKA
jgi:hypothetical protein